MKFRTIILSSFLIPTLLPLGAIADTVEDFQTWAAVIATVSPAGKEAPYRVWLEAQGRYDDDSSHLNQSLLRAAAGYRIRPRTVLWAGYGHINNDPQGTDEDVTEHRYWQQLTWSKEAPLLGFSLSTRTRLEQRTVESFDDTGWRFRHLSKVTRPLAFDGRLYLSAWDEFFVNLNDTDWGADDGLDQNRLFAGVGVRLAPSARGEVGYLNQWITRSGQPDAVNHVLSVTLLLNF